MRITSITAEPILEIPFLNAGKGQGSFYVDRLPVHTAEATGLPEDLDAIVATADLQGRERFKDAKIGPPRLLGEVLPHLLRSELLPRLGLNAERCGVVLAGDFYTVPNLDKRGGSGDVAEVWRAFGKNFKWAAGVAGNHDAFGDQVHPTRRLGRNIQYLDGEWTSVDGLKLAGVGGIIGNTRRAHRKTEEEFLAYVDLLLAEKPDLLIMHDGPDFPEDGLKGSTMVRQLLERRRPTLVVRGHAHWDIPLVELSGGTQVLNVDCRVVVVRRQTADRMQR